MGTYGFPKTEGDVMKKLLKNLWNLIGYTFVALLAVIGLAIGLPLLIH